VFSKFDEDPDPDPVAVNDGPIGFTLPLSLAWSLGGLAVPIGSRGKGFSKTFSSNNEGVEDDELELKFCVRGFFNFAAGGGISLQVMCRCSFCAILTSSILAVELGPGSGIELPGTLTTSRSFRLRDTFSFLPFGNCMSNSKSATLLIWNITE
jgi:hypothetical protein